MLVESVWDVGLIKLVKESVQIPVHVLVRPRAGDFVYNPQEVQVLCCRLFAIFLHSILAFCGRIGASSGYGGGSANWIV
jgi:CutC family